jgi:chromosome segregation ATPase
MSMTDTELAEGEARLDQLNDDLRQARRDLADTETEIHNRSIALKRLGLEHDKLKAHKHAIRSEYATIFEDVGIEKKRREKLAEEETEKESEKPAEA